MASAFLLATQFLAAGALLALAGWLLYLKFASAVHRSFALFLLLTSISIAINALRDLLAYAAGTDAMLVHLREYARLAAVPVLAHFVLQYVRPRDSGPAWQAALAGSVVLQLLLPLMYAWDHDVATHCPVDCEAAGGRVMGPLSIVAFGLPLTAAVAALFLAHWSVSGARPARRRPTLLLGGALVVHSVIQPAIALGILQAVGWSRLVGSYAPGAWVAPAHVVLLLAMPVALAALWQLHVAARQDEVAMSLARRITLLAAVAAAVGWGVGGSFLFGIQPTWALFFTGLLAMLVPFLVVYALVQHRLFGIDIKLRFTIKYSTIAGIMMAVFWTVSTVAQEFLAELYGWAIGGTAAGLLLFAINPLLRLGERLSTAAMPHTQPLAHMSHKERLRLFGDQAELVWMDGIMGVRERRLLDQLRERLGITAEEALRLESRAASAHGTGSTRKLLLEPGG